MPGARQLQMRNVAWRGSEMPVQETLELIAALHQRLARDPDLMLVNGLYPPADQDESGGREDEDPQVELWRRRRAVNDRELRRLDDAWDGPRVDLPLLPLDRGPDLVAALRQGLEKSRPGRDP